jgi:hypothetical protein
MGDLAHLNAEFDAESFIWVFCWTVHRWNGPLHYHEEPLRKWTLPAEDAAAAKLLYLDFSQEEMPDVQPAHQCSGSVVNSFRLLLRRRRAKQWEASVYGMKGKSKTAPDPVRGDDILASDWIQYFFDAFQGDEESITAEQRQVFRLGDAEPIAYESAGVLEPCRLMQEMWPALEATCRGAIAKFTQPRQV